MRGHVIVINGVMVNKLLSQNAEKMVMESTLGIYMNGIKGV